MILSLSYFLVLEFDHSFGQQTDTSIDAVKGLRRRVLIGHGRITLREDKNCNEERNVGTYLL